ncbi:helicase HerA domain-containing protein [Nonomuraea sp. NPDC059007]|uniref:helicase HerA domain-containing protein n=1 Tax=Nonomuraea sp. NPDC059007 TaxID=3346692 RepID=UPI003689F9EB
MSEAEMRALHAVSSVLDWAATAEHAWNPPPFHVDGMHPRAERLILDGIDDASISSGTSPLGVVIQGEGGAGKTHLLGWVRGRIAQAGGYFFLVDFSAGEDFWRQTTRAMVEDLGRSAGGRGAPVQAMVALRALSTLAGADMRMRTALDGEAPLTRADLDVLVDGLVAKERRLLRCRDTIRAMALYAVASGQALDVGHDHLMSAAEAEEGDRQAWGMSRQVKSPHDIAIELSMILALTGPTVIAVDQIDALLEHSRTSEGAEIATTSPGGEPRKDVIDQIAGGLMALRHATQRTLCLVACLPSSWTLIKDRAIGTAQDRFRTSLILTTIASPEIATSLVERRLAEAFAKSGFTPPHPLWPIVPSAFDTAPGNTPRTLLRRISEHVEACRAEGVVGLLERFDQDEPGHTSPLPADAEPVVPESHLARLDTRFAELRATADVSDAFDPEHEDELAPPLLGAGLNAWITEQGEAGRVFSVDPLPGRRPNLHARLRQALDPESEEQRHWTFRVIGARHHIAALKRLTDGIEASGLSPETPDRCFVVLRNQAWSDGPTTRARLARLEECGGRSLPLRADDLRVFDALRQMEGDRDPAFDAWLRARRPASGTELLGGLLEAAVQELPEEPEPEATALPTAAAGITVGRRLDTGTDLVVQLSTLTRHTAVFAGSGSGKTVFLRRLVEECALHGVSSIVLDPNNDLARLGEPWPATPPGWSENDAAKAARYFTEAEIVVWTPGRSQGRPLSFQPLPDFAAVLDDRDELNSALGLAVETLAPRANAEGASAKARKAKAVLRQALEHFARSGGADFTAFLGMLASLPFEASQIDKADQIAAELGQLLTAAMINDPLFAGGGEAVDPARLLTPSTGKRARVSVISFIGLNDDARPGFVSGLQNSLFTWIKRNPARGRPLIGLYVMDEAQSLVPAGSKTEALASTLTLASQARKYGLGLVFATQMPRGLHNQIAGNATTQFIGRMNSPTQIAVVRSLAQARGGRADRVGRLEAGQFYAASTGIPEALIRAPHCLSHHPADPLTEREIMQRAAG